MNSAAVLSKSFDQLAGGQHESAALEPRLPTPAEEARAFWRLRLKTFRITLRQAFETSRLRVSLVIFLSLFFWVGLFVLFHEAFHFLSNTIGTSSTHTQTVQAIYNVFFASLMVMLVFSSAIIL